MVKDGDEAEWLAQWLEAGDKDVAAFWSRFDGRTTEGFDPLTDLNRVGVVNQTTMLATDTQAIADRIKVAVGDDRFANTRDTLCYATNDNQNATRGALEAGGADLAIVVGGYNSSNTSHLVELCEMEIPTLFVRNELEWKEDGVHHFNIHTDQEEVTSDPWPRPDHGRPPTILITSGASCPDASVDRVLHKVLESHPGGRNVDVVLTEFEQTQG